MANTTADPVVVENTSHVISTVLEMRGRTSVRYARQLEPTGPWDAIRLAAKHISTNRLLVTFCDNVYPLMPLADTQEYQYATVRSFDNCPQLDYWSVSARRWMRRDNQSGKLAFAGYCVLERKEVLDFPGYGMSLIDVFNELKVLPYHDRTPGWHDIGNVTSYLEYMRCVS